MDIKQTDGSDLRGDLLKGAGKICAFLVELGLEGTTEADIYYLKKSGWPIGKTSGGKGGKLIASKRRLTRHAQKISSPAS
jgi:hypothetical protein